jgi:thymidylate kinase
MAIMRDEAGVGIDLDAPVIELFLHLLAAINRNDIRCCYWKSSRRLPAALMGETDLDLLCSRRDQHRLQECLLATGFKLFPTVSSRSDPFTVSYLGYDELNGRIVHVHLHMRLVSGNRLLLDYRLPWEEKALAWSIPHPRFPIRVLDPETEALLLIVREALELRRSDPVVARSWTAIQKKFEADRQALAAQVDRRTLRLRTADLMGEDIADALAEALTNDLPLERQHRLRRQIRRRLSAYRRFNAMEAYVRGAVRAAFWAAGALNQRYLHLPRPWRRRAPGGGIVVALMGVDGSGKSTAVAAIRNWLGSEVDTIPIYFGTGDGRPSLVLLPLKLLVPLFTRVVPSRPKGASHGKVSSRPPGAVYSVLLTLWSTALAVEKRLKLHQARRAADRGLVVIADRYPQDQIATFNDGPLLPRLRLVPQWLRRFEAGAYRLARQLPPDLVVKLTASPELLATREPTMNRDVIQQRVGELRMLAFPDSTVVCIDAAQSRDEVIRQIKHEIWRLL